GPGPDAKPPGTGGPWPPPAARRGKCPGRSPAAGDGPACRAALPPELFRAEERQREHRARALNRQARLPVTPAAQRDQPESITRAAGQHTPRRPPRPDTAPPARDPPDRT